MWILFTGPALFVLWYSNLTYVICERPRQLAAIDLNLNENFLSSLGGDLWLRWAVRSALPVLSRPVPGWRCCGCRTTACPSTPSRRACWPTVRWRSVNISQFSIRHFQISTLLLEGNLFEIKALQSEFASKQWTLLHVILMFKHILG